MDLTKIIEDRISQLSDLIATDKHSSEWHAWNDMLIRYIELRVNLHDKGFC